MCPYILINSKGVKSITSFPSCQKIVADNISLVKEEISQMIFF
jgi:hypothetical protein